MWNQPKEVNGEVRRFVKNIDKQPQAFTLKNFLKAFLDEIIYGIDEVDIHLPDILKKFFMEFPSIYKIERQHLSAEMQENAKEFGLMKDGWTCLFASVFGDKIYDNHRLHPVVS